MTRVQPCIGDLTLNDAESNFVREEELIDYRCYCLVEKSGLSEATAPSGATDGERRLRRRGHSLPSATWHNWLG